MVVRGFLSRPLPRAALTSGALMAVGDVAAQLVTAHTRKGSTLVKRKGDKIELPDIQLPKLDLKLSSLQGALDSLRRTAQTLDLDRTARFALVGVTLHGPFFLFGFKWLDAVNVGPPGTLRTAISKSLLGQVTLFPAYLSAFSAYMGYLEGLRGQEIYDKWRSFIWPTFRTGCIIWPPANVINFAMVPPSGRVLYINCVGIIWNTILSYMNASSGKAPQAQQAAR
ncbi:unnamed protein product [Pedinophyceae sp. YPF-701]|nr:unnamed protein product [Pedinophyceae sp. YPF-701]